MNCQSCADIGMIRVPWTDAPDDFAICLCAAGQSMRDDTNANKRTGYALWQVWAYRQQIDPSRVFLIEEVLTPSELAERGFQAAVLPAVAQDRQTALLAAGRGKKVRL